MRVDHVLTAFLVCVKRMTYESPVMTESSVEPSLLELEPQSQEPNEHPLPPPPVPSVVATSVSVARTAVSPPLDARSILYMTLLAIQFGCQPMLTRAFTPRHIPRSTVILVQEVVKFVMAGSLLYGSGGLQTATQGWSVRSWLTVAGVPAVLYAIQNICALTAYQNLDALTFNVLNQTKTLSAAACCYFVMGTPQSPGQIMALCLLLTAALVMEGIVPLNPTQIVLATPDLVVDPRRLTHGVLPILIASFLSGLAGALSQRNLQAATTTSTRPQPGRNSYLFSMELCAATVVVLVTSLAFSSDGSQLWQQGGFWNGWTPTTFIPIFTNAMGGIIVGLVTKHAGSVRKGFALIFGIFLSGIMQSQSHAAMVTTEQLVGGAIASISLYLHATHPPAPKREEKWKRE
jgi:solute carrier family 35 (UDP-sugar transporter), member A1/2/3